MRSCNVRREQLEMPTLWLLPWCPRRCCGPADRPSGAKWTEPWVWQHILFKHCPVSVVLSLFKGQDPSRVCFRTSLASWSRELTWPQSEGRGLFWFPPRYTCRAGYSGCEQTYMSLSLCVCVCFHRAIALPIQTVCDLIMHFNAIYFDIIYFDIIYLDTIQYNII